MNTYECSVSQDFPSPAGILSKASRSQNGLQATFQPTGNTKRQSNWESFKQGLNELNLEATSQQRRQKGGKGKERNFFLFPKKALTRSVIKKMWNCVFLASICQERGEETSNGLQSRTLFKVIILNSRLYLNNNLRNGEPAGSLLRCVPRARAGPGEVLQLGTHSSSPSWGQEPRNFSLRHVFSAYASVGSWNWVHG